MIRLFYRLVGTLRQRTIEAVEAIGAWHRKTHSDLPFVYYGVDYLGTIGQDLRFLDMFAFLKSR